MYSSLSLIICASNCSILSHEAFSRESIEYIDGGYSSYESSPKSSCVGFSFANEKSSNYVPFEENLNNDFFNQMSNDILLDQINRNPNFEKKALFSLVEKVISYGLEHIVTIESTMTRISKTKKLTSSKRLEKLASQIIDFLSINRECNVKLCLELLIGAQCPISQTKATLQDYLLVSIGDPSKIHLLNINDLKSNAFAFNSRLKNKTPEYFTASLENSKSKILDTLKPAKLRENEITVLLCFLSSVYDLLSYIDCNYDLDVNYITEYINSNIKPTDTLRLKKESSIFCIFHLFLKQAMALFSKPTTQNFFSNGKKENGLAKYNNVLSHFIVFLDCISEPQEHIPAFWTSFSKPKELRKTVEYTVANNMLLINLSFACIVESAAIVKKGELLSNEITKEVIYKKATSLFVRTLLNNVCIFSSFRAQETGDKFLKNNIRFTFIE